MSTEPPPNPQEPVPTTTAALVLLAINKFGKDVFLVLLFSAVIALAGRQIYRDLIISNSAVIAIARERAEQDKLLTSALQDLAKEVHASNRVLAEREREFSREKERVGEKEDEETPPP